MPLEQLAAAKIELLPSLQLVMADQPIFSIWQTNQEQCEDEQEAQKIYLDESQQVLIVRPAYTLSMYNIDLCTYQLIDSLGKGYQLQKAIEISLETDSSVDVSRMIHFSVKEKLISAIF